MKKLRPIRVAVKRANEILAIITASENAIEENAFCEWVDLTLIDTDNIKIPVNNDDNSQMPIYNVIQKWCLWEDDLEQLTAWEDKDSEVTERWYVNFNRSRNLFYICPYSAGKLDPTPC